MRIDKTFNKVLKHKIGFTLLELLVVIAIIALILAVIPINSGKAIRTAKTNAIMLIVSSDLRTYYIEYQKWPDQEKWIEELKESAQDEEIENWDSLLIDSWKNPIQYRIVEKDGIQTVLLYCFGKNKLDDNGTGDDILREVDIPTQEEIDNYKANTEAPSTPAVSSEPNNTAVQTRTIKTEFVQLEYADEIEALAAQIAEILNSIETVEDANQAVETLTPLGKEYRELNLQFSKYYLQNRGPAFNKLNNHPKPVQRAVFRHLQKTVILEESVVYNFYGKNLPKKLKFKVADTAQFHGPSIMMGRKAWEKWKKRIDAPYIPPDPNAIPDPNSPVDPNQ